MRSRLSTCQPASVLPLGLAHTGANVGLRGVSPSPPPREERGGEEEAELIRIFCGCDDFRFFQRPHRMNLFSAARNRRPPLGPIFRPETDRFFCRTLRYSKFAVGRWTLDFGRSAFSP